MKLDSPPRIALFLRYLGGGGADQMLLHLAQGFLDQGYSVDLVLGAAWGPHLWKIPPGVELVDLGSRGIVGCFWKLVQYLRREQPAVLLSTLHYSNEIALLAKQVARVPTRVYVREANTPSEEARQLTQLKKRLTPYLIKGLYPSADGIIAVSQGVANDLAQIVGGPTERIHVVYNPSITPAVLAKANDPVEHPWFAPGEPPVILGVGKLQKQKDFPTLIRAFAQVRKVRPCRLMILGWGPDRPQLEALIQALGIAEDVDLPDYIKVPYPYMARASVFVLSSAWEGLPNVLIEAMAVGAPLVATDCKSGPSEILDTGEYGSLIPVGDSEAMASAILQVLDGDVRRPPASWLEQFTLQVAVQQYLAVFGLASALDREVEAEKVLS